MQKLLVANFKMNGNINFYKGVKNKFNKLKLKDTVILCPPFVYMPFLQIKNKMVSIGSQNVSNVENAKSTGQISCSMLREFGVKYSIIGHSERRAIGESDSLVAEKVNNCLVNDICPIVCVGEQSKSSSLNCLTEQVKIAVSKIKTNNIIFAYEPVWAIGSGEIPTNTQINKAITLIKTTLKKEGFINVKVLYGGSVNEQNYKGLLSTKADGFLLGGISLKLDKLETLINGVHNE